MKDFIIRCLAYGVWYITFNKYFNMSESHSVFCSAVIVSINAIENAVYKTRGKK